MITLACSEQDRTFVIDVTGDLPKLNEPRLTVLWCQNATWLRLEELVASLLANVHHADVLHKLFGGISYKSYVDEAHEKCTYATNREELLRGAAHIQQEMENYKEVSEHPPKPHSKERYGDAAP